MGSVPFTPQHEEDTRPSNDRTFWVAGEVSSEFAPGGPVTFEKGVLLYNVHPKDTCRPPCGFHAPSNHPLRNWPLAYDVWKERLQRVCPDHGDLHADPDTFEYKATLCKCDCNCCRQAFSDLVM
jgi:hypothetical protein